MSDNLNWNVACKMKHTFYPNTSCSVNCHAANQLLYNVSYIMYPTLYKLNTINVVFVLFFVFTVEAVAALGNKVVETLRTQDPTEGSNTLRG